MTITISLTDADGGGTDVLAVHDRQSRTGARDLSAILPAVTLEYLSLSSSGLSGHTRPCAGHNGGPGCCAAICTTTTCSSIPIEGGWR
jgi:hypothetical protein